VTTPRGEVAFTKDESPRGLPTRLRSNVNVVVVKAQIHAGGRGKAGGVKLARSSDEGRRTRQPHLGMKLVHSAKPAPPVGSSSVCLSKKASDIKRELYLGLLVDRASGHVVFMASAAGRHGDRGSRERTIPVPFCASYIHPAVGLQAVPGPPKIAFGLGFA